MPEEFWENISDQGYKKWCDTYSELERMQLMLNSYSPNVQPSQSSPYGDCRGAPDHTHRKTNLKLVWNYPRMWIPYHRSTERAKPVQP